MAADGEELGSSKNCEVQALGVPQLQGCMMPRGHGGVWRWGGCGAAAGAAVKGTPC